MTTNVDNSKLVMYIIMKPEIPIQLIYVENVGNNTPNTFEIEYFYMEYSKINDFYFAWIVLKNVYSGKVTSRLLYI